MKRQQWRAALLLLSFLLMSVTFVYISPYLMMLGLAGGVIAAGLIFWVLAFLLAFLTGRAFCGYLCPMGAEQELIDRLVKIELRTIPHLQYLKILLAIIWLAGAVFLAAAAGGLALDPLYLLGNGLPPWPAATYAFFYVMTLGVFLLVLILGRRALCRYFCPMSVVFMAITALKDRLKIPSLHLEAEPGSCIHCRKCTASCPMSLPVQEMVEKNRIQDPECILCLNCAESCPKSVIRYAMCWRN